MHYQSLAARERIATHRAMDTLQRRFGKLLGAHRRNAEITQPQLAERVGISVDMIKKLETGVVAPSFRTIEAISNDLGVDPAELFSSQVIGSGLQRTALREITDQLAVLDDELLLSLRKVINAALSSKR